MAVSTRVSMRSAVDPFLAMDVITEARQLAAEGRHIIHMEVGEPGWPAPDAALDAARRCIDGGRIGYTQALGLPSLRARIARHYAETYGIEVPASRIAVTTGSSAGFVLAFTAMFDAGERVAITSPSYPPYRNTLKALGLEAVEIETGAASRWAPTAAAIRAAHRDKPLAGLLIMSPGNPTGTMIGKEALAEIAETCAELKIALISDEIYHGLTYGEPATTALSVAPDAVVIHSFSKYFRMTGWRIGWMVLPEILVRTVERLTQNLYISAPEIAQVAAEAAMDATEALEAYHQSLARNRALLLEALPKMGLSEFLPIDGAFYVFADVSRYTNDSTAFARALLHEAGVAATPGIDFDRQRGNAYLRLSFAGSEADIAEAVKRLEGFMANR